MRKLLDIFYQITTDFCLSTDTEGDQRGVAILGIRQAQINRTKTEQISETLEFRTRKFGVRASETLIVK